MKYSTIPLAQAVVAKCQEYNITSIIISPGSRNAPLTITFTENSFFTCYSIVDERCAAFFALGIAQNTRKPAALVCSSGSALLNYYPAIAEAYYSQIPLVIISADRPEYKLEIGDGQTIQQQYVFGKHVGYSAILKQDVSHAVAQVEHYRPEWLKNKSITALQAIVQNANLKEIDKTLTIACNKELPVHLNVPLEEPLYNTQSTPILFEEISNKPPKTNNIPELQHFSEVWQESERKIVLVGVSYPNTIDKELLEKLAKDPTVLVLTETTSNLHHPSFFNSIDTLLAPLELLEDKAVHFKNLQPTILLTFGGLIVSKKIKAFLRNYAPKHHWHVGFKKANDTFNCLEAHLEITVNSILHCFYQNYTPKESSYFSYWNTIRNKCSTLQEVYLNEIPFSDFSAFHLVLNAIPNSFQVHLANSSTVRYAQLFNLNPSLQVYCNRGTSGIDGSTSTALGASQLAVTPTLLITGDLSFFYDSNALWNNYIRKDFRIILINNSGGGIFRILPGKEATENFERFFETKHTLNGAGLCEMYGFEYENVSDNASLSKALKDFYTISDKPKLLEVQTPRLMNDKILLDYFRFIS